MSPVCYAAALRMIRLNEGGGRTPVRGGHVGPEANLSAYTETSHDSFTSFMFLEQLRSAACINTWSIGRCRLSAPALSYLRRVWGRPCPGPPGAGPAARCRCSLWSPRGTRSRSTACACSLRRGEEEGTLIFCCWKRSTKYSVCVVLMLTNVLISTRSRVSLFFTFPEHFVEAVFNHASAGRKCIFMSWGSD